MNRNSVKFIISKKRETERLADLFAEYKWFVDNNFPIILPKIFQTVKDDLLKKQSKKQLLVLVNQILKDKYNKDKYLTSKELIKQEWKKAEKDFFEIVSKYKFKVRNKYCCYISLYGPMGQFFYPDSIDVRATKKDIKLINETIAHEIIHLLIFNKIKKLKLDYKETESIVDLFFKQTELKEIFPNYQLQNSIKHNLKQFKSFVS
ncbi:MAG: hypothetical protein ABIF17_04345 [Patescibacteria group bacterium]